MDKLWKLWGKGAPRGLPGPGEADPRTGGPPQFEPYPPWLLVIRAVMVLAAYGAVWLSVRGQHPYTVPTVAAIPGVFAFVVCHD